MQKTMLAAALALVSASLCTTAFASPITFFGEDINNNGPNSAPLTSFPNSNAAAASFLANLTGVGTQTFDGLSVGATTPLAITFPGAGTATLLGGGQVRAGNDGIGHYPISGNQYFWASTSNAAIDFSTPIAAFGFYGIDIGDYGGNLTLTVTDTNNNQSVINVPDQISPNGQISGSVLYFGFYDTTSQYTSIAFGNNSGVDQFAYDNMTIGSLSQVNPVNPVPEPPSLGMLGLGLLSVGWLYRRHREARRSMRLTGCNIV